MSQQSEVLEWSAFALRAHFLHFKEEKKDEKVDFDISLLAGCPFACGL